MKTKDLPYKNKGDLTKGPIKNHLMRLTIPMIWGILAIISVQMVDMYFISMLGVHKLAGISFTFPVTMVITHLTFGINIALSSVVSRLIGSKKTDEAKRVVLHGLFLGFTTAAVTATLCYVFLDPLFTLLGADAQTLPVIREYMPLWLVGSVLLALPVNGNSAIRAGGDSFLPAIVMTTMAVVNVILDPFLIFGWGPFPEMGVKGAAAATLCGEATSACLGLYFLVFRKKLVACNGLYLKELGNSLKRLAIIAVPASITNVIQPLTNAFVVALVAIYGPEAVAAYGIATRIEAIALLIVIALALGMAPIIGQNWGAQIYERVHKTINLAIGFNFVWSFLIALLLGLFARPVAALFTDDGAVIYFAVLFFWIVPFSYAFGNLVMGWASAFNAMGMPQRAFFMIVVKSLLLTIPAVYVGNMTYGIHGIFIALAAVNVISGVFFHITSWRICHAREEEGGAHQPA